jgi:3-methyladenine DNA glycosylase/8-oxoguanine DNA glycosylase
MKLRKTKTIEFIPSAPFHFDSTFYKPDHFTSGDNDWEPGIRWQTWAWLGACFGLKFQDKGTIDEPRLQIDIYTDQKKSDHLIASLVDEIKYRYNLELDLKGFYKEFRKDPTLGQIIRRWRGMRPGHPSSLYEYLMIGIVLQNATVRRSIQMFGALLQNYGTCLEFNGKQLWCFWEPGSLRKVTEEELRALKVGYRAKSIKRIDDSFVQGTVDEFDLRKKDRETQMQELLKLYGVGPATVWYLLFDVFHHWDFFNHVSPWEQKIYSKLFFDRDLERPVPVDRILKHFERFGVYKQLAVHYIWEDLWWQRKAGQTPWLEKLIRV